MDHGDLYDPRPSRHAGGGGGGGGVSNLHGQLFFGTFLTYN
jgi:hypothetical protein